MISPSYPLRDNARPSHSIIGLWPTGYTPAVSPEHYSLIKLILHTTPPVAAWQTREMQMFAHLGSKIKIRSSPHFEF